MEKLSEIVGLRGGVPLRAYAKLVAFRRDVERALPQQVKEVVLFGSRARGDATRNSDYDIAIILQGSDAGTVMDRRLSDLAYPYLIDGIHIRPISMSAEHLETVANFPLARSIAREGVILS